MAEILANPMVEALLAAIILISLAAEVKTAGFSGGALVAAIAGAILIGARWGDGSPSVMEFILFFSGMALFRLRRLRHGVIVVNAAVKVVV